MIALRTRHRLTTTLLSHPPFTSSSPSSLTSHFSPPLSNFSSTRLYTSTTPTLLSSLPSHKILTMPALSPTMTTGTISSWYIKEGDSFPADSSICSIETDKATLDYEVTDDGFLVKIIVNSGEVEVGKGIAVVTEEECDHLLFKDFKVEGENESSSSPSVAAAAAAEPTTTTSTPPPTGKRPPPDFILAPAARHIAQSSSVDALGLYPGTGLHGRVTKGDLIGALKVGDSRLKSLTAPAAASLLASASKPSPTWLSSSSSPQLTTSSSSSSKPYTYTYKSLPPPQAITTTPSKTTPTSQIRKIISSRLSDSKSFTPHYYITHSINLDGVVRLRKEALARGVKLSVNDFIIKAVSLALRDFPEVNSYYDSVSGTVKLYGNKSDISIAVSTPAGLITPIVFSADKLTLSEISITVKDLAGRAKLNKLKPNEFQGGCFTISNLGMFGINEFSAVINSPQSSILAVGAGSSKLVAYDYNDTDSDGSVVVRRRAKESSAMNVQLSFDRRVCDEGTAAAFVDCVGVYLGGEEMLL